MSTIREAAEALMSNEIKAFNTGRLYTEAGQRIAWTVLPSGKVAMMDRDRMIQYVLTVDFNGPLERAYRAIVQDTNDALVLQAYDRHDGTMPWGADYQEFHKVSAALSEASANAPVVKRR